MKKKRFIKFLERYLKEKLNKNEKHQTQLKEKSLYGLPINRKREKHHTII